MKKFKLILTFVIAMIFLLILAACAGEEQEYVVILDGNGATLSTTVVLIKKNEELKIEDPTWDGYTFMGWFDAKTGGNKIGKITKNITAYAQWTEKEQFTVTLNGNGAILTTTTVMVKNNEWLSVDDPTRVGYTFEGWFDAATSGEMIGKITKDITAYAHWKIIEYALTYDNIKGNTITSAPTKYTFETATIILPILPQTTEGGNTFRFEGWKMLGQTVAQIVKGSTGNKTVTAQWTQVYNVTLKEDTQTDVTGYFATIDELKANVEPKVGYTFKIFDNASGIGAEVLTLQTDKTYYVSWTPIKIILDLALNGGTFPSGAANSVEVSYDAVIILPTPIREGYIFDGWFIATVMVDDSKPSTFTENQTLVAKWLPITEFDVTFHTSLSTIFDSTGATNEQTITLEIKTGDRFGTLPAVVALENALFDGWYIGSEKITENTIFNYTEAITVNAKWIYQN